MDSCKAPLVEAASRSDAVEVGSVAVVSQRPGSSGGSLREGKYDVEVTGGICSDTDNLEESVIAAIFEAEMLSYILAIAAAKEDRRTISV